MAGTTQNSKIVALQRAINSFNTRYGLKQPQLTADGVYGDATNRESKWTQWLLGFRVTQIGHWSLATVVLWLSHPSLYFATHPGGYIRHRQRLASVRQPAAASHISPNGVKFIADFEGFSATWYDDGTGTQTIGFGHTSEGGVPRPPISRQQGLDLLHRDLVQYENGVKARIHRGLTQNQFDALTSFAYNLGPGVLDDGIAAAINRGDYKQATGLMLQYTHAGGTVLAGLVRRRKAEVALFEGRG